MNRIVCPDDYRYVDGKYQYDLNSEPDVWSKVYASLTKVMESNQHHERHLVCPIGIPGSGKSHFCRDMSNSSNPGNVYLDSTNHLPFFRNHIVKLARKYQHVIWYAYLDVSIGICLARNADRPDDRKIPESVIREIHSELSIPGVDEEWDMMSRHCLR